METPPTPGIREEQESLLQPTQKIPRVRLYRSTAAKVVGSFHRRHRSRVRVRFRCCNSAGIRVPQSFKSNSQVQAAALTAAVCALLLLCLEPPLLSLHAADSLCCALDVHSLGPVICTFFCRCNPVVALSSAICYLLCCAVRCASAVC